jgi:hypothetical protein
LYDLQLICAIYASGVTPPPRNCQRMCCTAPPTRTCPNLRPNQRRREAYIAEWGPSEILWSPETQPCLVATCVRANVAFSASQAPAKDQCVRGGTNWFSTALESSSAVYLCPRVRRPGNHSRSQPAAAEAPCDDHIRPESQPSVTLVTDLDPAPTRPPSTPSTTEADIRWQL